MQIGKINKLIVSKLVSFGAYLDAGDGTEILLPTRYVPEKCEIGDEIDVFIYHDNEGRLVATTIRPHAIIGEFQWMKVREISNAGAFLEWGIMKDLLVPHREQKESMQPGKWYLIYVYLDHISNRIVGSSKIDKFLDNTPPLYEFNQEVDLLVSEKTDMGYKVIINQSHWGLLYHNEVFRTLEKGEKLKGYIKNIRDDEKIDVSLQKLGYEKIDGVASHILETLKNNNGYLPVHDKSDAERINALFGCSKKNFKKAIGSLYKQKLITLENNGIRLIKEDLKKHFT